MAHDSGQTPEGAPSGDQPNNTAWVVGAVVAIAVLATVLTLIGIKAGDDETTPTANPPVVAPPVATAPAVATSSAKPSASASASVKPSASAASSAKPSA